MEGREIVKTFDLFDYKVAMKYAGTKSFATNARKIYNRQEKEIFVGKFDSLKVRDHKIVEVYNKGELEG